MKEQPEWTPIDYSKSSPESEEEPHRAAIKEWDQLTRVWERLNLERKAAVQDLEDPTKDELLQEMSAELRSVFSAFEQASEFIDRYLSGVAKALGPPRQSPR